MNQPTNPFPLVAGKCPNCMEMLQLILDDQATQEQKDYFKSHMDSCMPCFKSYQLDMAIKELVKRKCCGGDAPTELIHTIKNQIAQKI